MSLVERVPAGDRHVVHVVVGVPTSSRVEEHGAADLRMAPGPIAPERAEYLKLDLELDSTDVEASPVLRGFTVTYMCNSMVQ